MSTPVATDTYLVTRGDDSFHVTQENIMATLQDTDLLLVNRSGESYKITGADFKASAGGGGIQPGSNDISISPPVPGSGTLADPFILSTVQIGPYGASTQSEETLTIDGQAADEAVVWTNNSTGAAITRFEQPDGVTTAAGVWTGKLLYTDTPSSTTPATYQGNLQIGSLYFQWDVTQNATAEIAPVIGSASLVEVDPEGDRFTSQDFTVAITMTEEGIPASDKQLKGYVEGTLKQHFETDVITDVNNNTLTFATNKDLSDFSAGTQVSQDVAITPVTSAITNVDIVAVSPPYTAGSSNWDEISPYSLKKFYVTDSYLGSGYANTLKVYTFNSTDGSINDGVTSNPFSGSGLALISKGPGDTVYALSGDIGKPIRKSTDGGLNWSSYGSGTIQSFDQMDGNPLPIVNNNLYWMYQKRVKYTSIATPPTNGDHVQVGGAQLGTNSHGFCIDEDTGGFVHYSSAEWAYSSSLGVDQVKQSFSAGSGTGQLSQKIQAIVCHNSTYVVSNEDGIYTSSSPTTNSSWTLQGLSAAYPWASAVSQPGGFVSAMYVDNSGRLLVQVRSSGTTKYSGVWVSDTPLSPIPASFTYVDTGSTTVNTQAADDPGCIDGSSDGSRVVVSNGKASGSQSSIFGGTETVLTLTDNTQLNNFQVGDSVTETSGDGTGTVTAIDATSLSLSPYGGTWSNGSTVTGVSIFGTGTVVSTNPSAKTMTVDSGRWAVGAKVEGDVEVANSKLYTVLSANGQVLSLVGSDPGYTTMAGNPNYTLTFPAQFPSGDAPDTDLPAGTSFTVDVRATNSAGNSDATTNSVVPVSPPSVAGSFSTDLYPGNQGLQPIINGIDFSGGEGLVWLKSRDDSNPSSSTHALVDTVRGDRSVLQSNNDNSASIVSDAYPAIQTFNNDGYTLGYYNSTNSNGINYVGWSFKSAPAFFDVVTWSGNSTAGRTIPHNLSSQPGMVVVKCTTHTGNWTVWHSSILNTQALWLQSDDAVYNQSEDSVNIWNSTTPTSTEFTVGDWDGVNGPSDHSYIAYLFAEDTADLIKCGSYVGTGATQTIDCGFEPQWVMIKQASRAGGVTAGLGDWVIVDKDRLPDVLEANTVDEEDGNNSITSGFFQPTGFQVTGNNDSVNDSYGPPTYIYVAIAAPPDGAFYTDDAEQVAAYNELSAAFGAYEQKRDDRMADINSYLAAGGYSIDPEPYMHICDEEES